ncbi:DUF2267 domain-containing protein [Streptomyces decoyicus]
MSYEQMLEKVRYEGAYPARERAEEAVQLVLAGLGRQLTGDERVELAARLPFEAARVLTAQIPDTQPLTGWAFVRDLAARTARSATRPGMTAGKDRPLLIRPARYETAVRLPPQGECGEGRPSTR